MFAFKDFTAIHWLVALINKKSSQSKKQDQRKKKEKERKVNRLVLSGRILHKSLNFIIKSYIVALRPGNRQVSQSQTMCFHKTLR